ncbi:MAPEG family protein [Pseudomonas mangiferae]|uniref:MAPEG family protein n=1 Tax=Pseudomonas mangiferae TaxID=2593654 RepID=A0A553GXW8_9PSED|nr:MAPEG family protein [Pseudomonas mangiferae]TRX74341.1 MAPEG family protein [Pseudomonas mangiferae]
MTIPFWCLFIAAVLIYVAKLPVAKAMQADGGYDNHHPRAQQARLTGYGARAYAAHMNSIEIFPLFAAGVLMAHSAHVVGYLVDVLAIVFVVSRVIYLVCYLRDLHWQRSSVWMLGMLCCLLLMLSPALRALFAGGV